MGVLKGLLRRGDARDMKAGRIGLGVDLKTGKDGSRSVRHGPSRLEEVVLDLLGGEEVVVDLVGLKEGVLDLLGGDEGPVERGGESDDRAALSCRLGWALGRTMRVGGRNGFLRTRSAESLMLCVRVPH